MAVNSGNYWPKQFLIKKSGKIIIKFLPPIKSHLTRNKVLSEVETIIEEATKKII